ncbi:MAG: ABC transporter permease [Desulfurococcales archaeon]|jgi:ABC-type dipeptide/oligopeptide/nickel transport system permease subunit|nr:ABC transporter permease [Desulfurococcales archaeon]
MTLLGDRRRDEMSLSIKFYIGLSIVLFYAALGTYSMIAGYIGSFTSMWEADYLAMPVWASYIFEPGLPPTIEKRLEDWGIESLSSHIVVNSIDRYSLNITLTAPGSYMVISNSFEYPYRPARSMIIGYNIRVFSENSVRFRINLSIVSDKLLNKSISIEYGGIREEITAGRYAVLLVEDIIIDRGSKIYNSSIKLPYPFLNRVQEPPIPIIVNPVSQLLLDRDTRIRGIINISYTCIDRDLRACRGLNIEIRDISIKILGLAHGLLGTDHRGSDIWRQFVEGARVANIFGLSAAAATVILGISIGSVSGFRVGRFSDQVLTFITDTIFFLPAIPLIMIVIVAFGRSMPILYGLIVLVSWPGLARLARSWAMAIRGEPYIETAIAIGASRLWILRKHVLPRLAPLAVYGLVSLVPGVISTEVLIQFIGFGDPNIPSWGRMLNEAYSEGALINGAWWWLFAPIAGITSYMAGFVLMGMALEERLNPKLVYTRRSPSR